MKTQIIMEDKDLLVVWKPAGLATQSARVSAPDVVSELKNYRAKKQEDPYIGVVHRLDQPVEGLLVFAKTKKAAAALSAGLSDHTLNKSYRALVVTSTESEDGVLEDYLVKEENMARVSEKGNPQAKPARLHYRIQRLGDGYGEAFVELETGRFHQIRAQMAHAGHSLLGDQKYGSRESVLLGQKLRLKDVALCADRICIKHPVTGKQLTFSVEPTFLKD